MPPLLWFATANAIVFLAALAGTQLTRLTVTHTRLQMAMSFVGGFLLGIAALHLLPHAVEAPGGPDRAFLGFIIGLVLVYAILRFTGPAGESHTHANEPAEAGESGGGQHSESQHPESKHHNHRHSHPKRLGRLSGLAAHAILDGLVLAAAYLAEASGDHPVALPGLAALIAITLHKPLDTFSIATIDGATKGRLTAPVLITAALTPIVASLVLVIDLANLASVSSFGSAGLGLGAGILLCVALADVLPEVRFHGHDRARMAISLLSGITIAWGIAKLEHQLHIHDHEHHEDSVSESLSPLRGHEGHGH